MNTYMNHNFSIVPHMLNKSPKFAAYAAKNFAFITKTTNVDYRVLKGRTQNLSLVYMKLTPRCNLRCLMCGQRGIKGVLKGRHAMDE